MSDNVKVCPNCRNAVGADLSFCPTCGTRLDTVAPTVVAPNLNNAVPAAAPAAVPAAAPAAVPTAAPATVPTATAPNFNAAVPGTVPGVVPGAAPAATPAAAPKKKTGLFIGIAVAVVILLVLIIAVSGGNKFSSKYASYADETWCTISSDGKTMKIDNNPYNTDDDYYDYSSSTASAALTAIKQVNNDLGFTSVYDDMLDTCWNDGTQYESNDKYSISWTYHPDYGLEVTYTIK